MVWAGANAQIKLNCTVVDGSTSEPVTGAIITLLEQDYPLESDEKGKAVFELGKTGIYTLQVDAPAYERLIREITIIEGSSEVDVTLRLKSSSTVLQAVEVTALRADEQTPVAYTNLDATAIAQRNSGRDIPFLMEQTPSVVATSDAGAGIGYTNIRVRGSDITRINVTVNGIPINDAESNGVFWVNMPDLASSTNSIQLQRGVGTSTNGAGAFGASLNMQTDGAKKEPYAMVNAGIGSFNTQRYTVQLGTGLINKHWWMSGRLSQITSDGYIDRATSNLKSYYLSGGYINDRTSLRAVVFGGKEITYQAWYGVDSATRASNRTFNYAGAIYNDAWEVVDFYDNQVDNYAQDHYQLHLNRILNDQFRLNVSLHYTYGRGYYEEYIQGAYMPDYNLNPIIGGADTISFTDLVWQKWLDNEFFGGIFNLQYSSEHFTSILGGGIHQYEGRHFGEVIWAQYASQSLPGNEFYRSYSVKTDANVYWKNLYQINSNLSAFLDLQVRSVAYRASGLDDDVGSFAFDQNNLFFNPKVGVNYIIFNGNRLYASYAVANREPNRTDMIYADPDDLPKPENLQDFELGFSGNTEKLNWDFNAFYMFYRNQLVLTGALDAVGYPIRKNIGRSYRLGIEIAVAWQPLSWLTWRPNITYMQSQNLDYIQELSDGTVRALGNTAIAYSPNLIAASALEFNLFKGLMFGVYSKYVGQQYLSNSESERLSLEGYFLNDLRLAYRVQPGWIQEIEVYMNALNIFNVEYSSNGYVYADMPYFYPQAGVNFLGGIQVSF